MNEPDRKVLNFSVRSTIEVGSILAVLLALGTIIYSMGIESGKAQDMRDDILQVKRVQRQHSTQNEEINERLAKIEAELSDIRDAVGANRENNR